MVGQTTQDCGRLKTQGWGPVSYPGSAQGATQNIPQTTASEVTLAQ